MATSQVRDERPNVIIILTDDQGTIDLNCFGSEDLHTPKMDALAASGIKFHQFYVAAPVCSPSRAALLTGLTPQGAGLPGNASSIPGHKGMPTEQYTMAEMMKDAGYATAHIGKWHLGYSPETMPLGQGFDYSFGHMGGCIDNYSHFFYWNGPNRHDLFENGEEVWYDGSYFPDLMAEKSDAFIEQHKDEPFFMYYAINMPHYPVQPDPHWRAYYATMEDQRRAHYAAFVSSVDERVGRLMNSLEKHGVKDNTIVVFLADHGHSNEVRNFGGGGNAGPYRGSKFSLFEGGIRVPAIVSWPKKIKPNQTRYQWVMSLDLMPTLADLCGAQLKNEVVGKSMVPILMHEDEPSKHEKHIWQSGAQWAVRKGKWKLVGNPVDHSGKGELDPVKDQLFLINLDEDRTELMNYASLVPEKVEELTQEYLAWEYAEPTLVPGNRPVFEHKGQTARVTLLQQPEDRYAKGATGKIIDGVSGTISFSDGNWLGFHGNHLDAVFDMGEVQSINRVSVGFLCDQQSHIFLPSRVEIYVSKDGKDFIPVATTQYTNKTVSKAKIIRPDFPLTEEVEARYVKVKAQNRERCPKGHNAEGETAWLFIDEVTID
jgi:arylsulfatase A-like enzyme